MSRLLDELKRVARSVPQPMGFKTTRPASSEPRVLLIASLAARVDTDRQADGADAVLLRLTKSQLTAKALQKIASSIPDIPWGIWLEDAAAGKMETLVEAGCDFVVFPPTSQVSATPQDDKVGKILQVESSLSDGLLRAVNDLPVDAVLNIDVCKAGDAIAWHHLMLLQRLSNLLTKPLLVSVTLPITADELKTLWEAGVDGVVIEAGTEAPAGGLRELRQAIGKLTFRRSRKWGKAEALLPRISSTTNAEPEEQEEEEDEGE